jgi:hypothetical protein
VADVRFFDIRIKGAHLKTVFHEILRLHVTTIALKLIPIQKDEWKIDNSTHLYVCEG